MSEALKRLVNRFLSWKLPDNFYPDCGISFVKPNHPTSWPVGTNLFTAEQAKDMIQHMLGDDVVVLPRDEFDSLWEDSAFLRALEAAGVDNWNGYELAQDIYREENEEDE